MKALRLTWLHSCPLGGRRHDYRAELVLPPLLAWTNTLFKETEWTRDERAGSPGPRLLLLFCWCCCFLNADFSTGVTCRAYATFICFCCFTVPEHTIMYRWRWTWTWSVSSQSSHVVPACFLPVCAVTLQQPDLCALSSEVNSLTASFQWSESIEFKVRCEKWVFWRENTLNCAFKLHQNVSEICSLSSVVVYLKETVSKVKITILKSAKNMNVK